MKSVPETIAHLNRTQATLLTTAQVCTALDVSDSSVWNAINNGVLSVEGKVGTSFVISKDRLLDLLVNHPQTLPNARARSIATLAREEHHVNLDEPAPPAPASAPAAEIDYDKLASKIVDKILLDSSFIELLGEGLIDHLVTKGLVNVAVKAQAPATAHHPTPAEMPKRKH